MESHLSNSWNNAVSFLAMSYGEEQLATGSGFFWRANDKTYLVTNWHNLSGRNPLTNEPMSKTCAIPDRVTFRAFKRLAEPDSNQRVPLLWLPIQVLLHGKDGLTPAWFEHPTWGRQVDVAAIDVTDAIVGLQVEAANELEADAALEPVASQEIYVVGFPFGILRNAPAPIWKRGSIALDPTFDLDDLPKMVVDTATREGMSGSVAIARHIVVGRGYPTKSGQSSPIALYATLDIVVGIYSGRHYPDLEKAQLGIVWKRRVIEQTVAGHKVAENAL